MLYRKHHRNIRSQQCVYNPHLPTVDAEDAFPSSDIYDSSRRTGFCASRHVPGFLRCCSLVAARRLRNLLSLLDSYPAWSSWYARKDLYARKADCCAAFVLLFAIGFAISIAGTVTSVAIAVSVARTLYDDVKQRGSLNQGISVRPSTRSVLK